MMIAIAALAQSWPKVDVMMRPGTRWWWMGSAVDSAGLDYQLRELARVGIGSVEITPIYGVQNNEANELEYLSPQWMKALDVTEKIAADCNIQVDMNQGTGWPFGGPEVLPEQAACKAVFLVDTLPEGENIDHCPVPEQFKNVIPEAVNYRTLLDGQREVIRLYVGRTRQTVKRAAPGGEGLVLDHFDRQAVANYLNKFDKAFTMSGVHYPDYFFNDSYEVYKADWTPTLLDEFAKCQGYRLEEHLAELLGYVDDGNKTLCDYRETLSRLLLENFTTQWVEWAHARGIKIRNQAHGSPANLIDLYAAVDIPEIEGFGLSDFGIKGLRTDPGFTRRNDSDVSMLKYASSAAHIAGKPYTSSETFTWLTEHFRASLSQMKPDLDLMFTCGVNHVMFHGTTYSPAHATWPGWKFYASVDMSPTNTIWHDADALMEYITSCQSMLQQGEPDNDFLVYLPVRDMWRQRLAPGAKGLLMSFSIHAMGRLAPDFIKSVMTIDSMGYDCDYISDQYLLSTGFDGTQLVTAAGTRYKALIIPGSGELSTALKEHLDSLGNAGANIIYGVDRDKIMQSAVSEPMRTYLGLRALRRKVDGGHQYFIANLSPHNIMDTVALAVPYTAAVFFDPMTGNIYGARQVDDKVVLHLRSGQSIFLVTYDSEVQHDVPQCMPIDVTRQYDLSDSPWLLTFPGEESIAGKIYALDSLKPWTLLGDSVLNQLAGTGVYTTRLNLNSDDIAGATGWKINLGDVRESARVYVNGQYVGTAWAVPFELAIDPTLLHEGDNEIEIHVTNLPANKIAAMDRQGVEWRKFKEINMVNIRYRHSDYSAWTTMPSGLHTVVVCRR